MSVLLIGLEGAAGEAIVARLLEQGDQVGVVEDDRAAAERWKRRGAHVAVGDTTDADLIERACQHARSVVVLAAGDDAAVLDAAVEACRLLPEPRPRLILYAERRAPEAVEAVKQSGLEYVGLWGGGERGWFGRVRTRAIEPARLAEAIDAADDLAAETHLDLDLAQPSGWEALRLEPPEDVRY